MHACMYSAVSQRCDEEGAIEIYGTVKDTVTEIVIAGRLEICVEGRWRAVYDGSWSDSEVRIVCEGLGFPEEGKN